MLTIDQHRERWKVAEPLPKDAMAPFDSELHSQHAN